MKICGLSDKIQQADGFPGEYNGDMYIITSGQILVWWTDIWKLQEAERNRKSYWSFKNSRRMIAKEY